MPTFKESSIGLSRQICVTTAVWLALHAAVCVLVFNLAPTRHPFPERGFFAFWDSAYYASIATDGYRERLWAFAPLYPLVVKILTSVTGLGSRPDIGGALYSTLFFAVFCGIQARLARGGNPRLKLLIPRTIEGWLMFLMSPASYIFHTNHTESLFLCLSFAAFWASRCAHWKTAAFVAGLCALTRNQGVFVALAVALDGALLHTSWRKRALVFVAGGAVSGMLFSCYPLYQNVQTGDALTFMHVQSEYWTMATNFREAIGTLWLKNPSQQGNPAEYLHLVLWAVQCCAAICLFFKRDYPLAAYVACSTLVILLQGQLSSIFRFGSVLFPMWYLLGDRTSEASPFVRWGVLVAATGFNVAYTCVYALGAWAY